MTATTPTKYVVLIYGSESDWESLTEDEMAAAFGMHEEFSRRAAEAGHEISEGEELQPIRTASFVRDGVVGATAGPYAELAEQLGGLYVVRTADLDDLQRLLAECFRGDRTLFEIRPTTTMEEPEAS